MNWMSDSSIETGLYHTPRKNGAQTPWASRTRPYAEEPHWRGPLGVELRGGAWYSPAVPTLPEKVSLDEIVRILVDQYGPIEKIILFGSYARGDTDEYSDLDLILIKRTSKRFVERLVEVPLLPVHADVFVYTPEEFEEMRENENPFILSALESAKVIYERPLENMNRQSS